MDFSEYRKLSRTEFTDKFGSLYEHSPWVAATAFDCFNKDKDIYRIGDFHACFVAAVKNASRQKQLGLLNAHPQLAVTQSDQPSLTDNSQKEQSGAGLDQCNAAQFQEFKTLNHDYLKKFGFPFIIAVKGLDRSEILCSFKKRLESSPEDEFDTALLQVCTIGRFRLESLVND